MWLVDMPFKSPLIYGFLQLTFFGCEIAVNFWFHQASNWRESDTIRGSSFCSLILGVLGNMHRWWPMLCVPMEGHRLPRRWPCQKQNNHNTQHLTGLNISNYHLQQILETEEQVQRYHKKSICKILTPKDKITQCFQQINYETGKGR